MRGGSLRLPATAALASVLSAICLGDLFDSGSWFLPAVFAVFLVTCAAELARRAGVPRVLVPVVAALVLLCYLVARYARDDALFWVLPRPAALSHLDDLVRRGNDSIARYAAPIAVLPEIELYAVAGVGLVAIAVDTLAVTMRRAALAGLPLLALYTVPASVAPGGVSWAAFLLGGAGYLALLLAESRERLSRWGRPLRFSATRADWRAEVDSSPLTQVGRRVGAAALGLALVVPALVPEFGAGAFGFGSGGLGRGGGGSNRVAVINPIFDLGKDLRQGKDRPVIRYEGSPTYLRMVADDVFTADSWRPSQLHVPRSQTVSHGLSAPPGLGPQVTQDKRHYRIQVFDLEEQWLPLPYPAKKVSIDGRWVYDQSTFNVFSTNTSTRQKTYSVTSLDVAPTEAQLRAAPQPPESMARYLELPLLPPVIAQTARQVTRNADTHYDQAMALQTWLRDPRQFTYSTEVSSALGDANGPEAIAAFLGTRRGYCVHFASTMAVMARVLGIPARVAIGFTAGHPDSQGRMVVGVHDAHAWPELYFEGAGWVAFEPTPPTRTGDPPPWARPDVTQGNLGGGQTAVPTPSAGVTGGTAPNRIRDPDLLRPQTHTSASNAPTSLVKRLNLPVVPTVTLLVLLLLGLVPRATRTVVRRARWRRATTPAARVTAAWAELCDTLADYGHAWRPSDSPRRGAARVTEELALTGEAAEAVRRLGAATERARYATDLGEVGDLRRDVTTVSRALAAGTGSWGRARARWLPRSVRSVSTAVSERLADGLDALDQSVASARNRLLPRRRRA